MSRRVPSTHLKLRLPNGQMVMCDLDVQAWLQHKGGLPRVGETLSFGLQLPPHPEDSPDATTFVSAAATVTHLEHALGYAAPAKPTPPAATILTAVLDPAILDLAPAITEDVVHSALMISGWRKIGAPLN